jgi:hypothetical protein
MTAIPELVELDERSVGCLCPLRPSG